MTFFVLLSGIVVGVVAFFVSNYHSTHYSSSYSKITKPIGWAGVAVGAIAVVILSVFGSSVGTSWAKGEQLTYNEYWNGYETQAVKDVTECTRDGGCVHEYDCDPYEVPVHHPAQYDSKGKMTSAAYTTYETHYHDCPYSTEEWTFVIKTSLGKDYVISSNGFPDNPREWRMGGGFPGDVFRGTPQFWAAAKIRIESGNPGPTTEVHTYKNYILASQNSILRQFSTEVDSFKSANKLPKVSSAQPEAGINSWYLGSKAYFVTAVPNKDKWTEAVNQFNAAFGTTLQGDMHVVFVDSQVDPAKYKGALNAYWTGPEFDKNGLSKNGLVLIIGVAGNTGVWMKAFTGMPVGNEGLITELESFKNFDLVDPTKILGAPKGIIRQDLKVKEVTRGTGIVEGIVWGPNKFQRVCMVCDDPSDTGSGFSYLDAEIEPTGGQTALVVFVMTLFFALTWGVIAFLEIPSPPLSKFNFKSERNK